jgi:hypothetical protein
MSAPATYWDSTLSDKPMMSPVRLAVASAFRPAPEGRCDGEVVGAAPFAELELTSGNTVLFAARS